MTCCVWHVISVRTHTCSVILAGFAKRGIFKIELLASLTHSLLWDKSSQTTENCKVQPPPHGSVPIYIMSWSLKFGLFSVSRTFLRRPLSICGHFSRCAATFSGHFLRMRLLFKKLTNWIISPVFAKINSYKWNWWYSICY